MASGPLDQALEEIAHGARAGSNAGASHLGTDGDAGTDGLDAGNDGVMGLDTPLQRLGNCRNDVFLGLANANAGRIDGSGVTTGWKSIKECLGIRNI